MMSKKRNLFLFAGLMIILGAGAGALIWMVLKIMDAGIEILWLDVPQYIGVSNMLIYNLAICIIGGLSIGLLQRKYGLLPEKMDMVLQRSKQEGGYPYNNLHILALMTLLPLIFGGAIGPEAGLSGFIAGICTFIGKKMKYTGEKIVSMTETGVASVLGVIFGAPFFGIVNNVEPDNKNEHYKEKFLSKKDRIIFYCLGVAGGMGAMRLLSCFFGSSGSLPRFAKEHAVGIDQWKWSILLIAVGIIAAIFFVFMDKCTSYLGQKILKYRVLSCVLTGTILAVVGYFIPETMFSGESQMSLLMENWQGYSIVMLVLIAVLKMILTNICINFGWHGGNIFPMIYAGVAIGYAVTAMLGGINDISALDGDFAVAIVVSAMCGYIMRKPFMVAAILLLCFPITYILSIIFAAFIASKVPLIKNL